MQIGTDAPEWQIEAWLNTHVPIDLPTLRGRVVVAGAFQMLCPGCVEHSIPQLKRVDALFESRDVAVVGLHTVFEHHAGMGQMSLAAFLHEYRVTFPVGIDQAGEQGDPIPKTMRRYAMQGTPTLLLIDRNGKLRLHKFGHLSDLQLGAEISLLIAEPGHAAAAGVRDVHACPVPPD